MTYLEAAQVLTMEKSKMITDFYPDRRCAMGLAIRALMQMDRIEKIVGGDLGDLKSYSCDSRNHSGNHVSFSAPRCDMGNHTILSSEETMP